jgi:isocitrate/isopropylmalate dehydrogenase
LSAVMLLQYLGFAEAASNLERAVKEVYVGGLALTKDQGGNSSTSEFCAAVGGRLLS